MGKGLPVVRDSVSAGDASKPLLVYGFDPMGGTTSSGSPFVAKLETFLRMGGIEYEAIASMEGAPKGKVPFIKQGDVTLGDSTFICEYLKNTYKGALKIKEPDTAEARAVATACLRLCEDHLYHGLIYYRWGTPKGWASTRKSVAGMVPMILRPVIPGIVRKGLLKALHGQGLSRHSEKDVIFLLTSTMTALSTFLGDKKYITGDEPCTADASMFGMLDNYLNDDMDLETARIVMGFPNLVRYVADIRKAYYPEDNPTKLKMGGKAREQKA